VEEEATPPELPVELKLEVVDARTAALPDQLDHPVLLETLDVPVTPELLAHPETPEVHPLNHVPQLPLPHANNALLAHPDHLVLPDLMVMLAVPDNPDKEEDKVPQDLLDPKDLPVHPVTPVALDNPEAPVNLPNRPQSLLDLPDHPEMLELPALLDNPEPQDKEVALDHPDQKDPLVLPDPPETPAPLVPQETPANPVVLAKRVSAPNTAPSTVECSSKMELAVKNRSYFFLFSFLCFFVRVSTLHDNKV